MATQINLFGGPGTGKSTTATGLFHRMKRKGYKAEYNPEFAKSLTYGRDFTRLKDQLLILATQHHPQWVMEGQVDYVIHDSPFVMGLTYLAEDPHLPVNEFKALSVAMYKTYDNINIFLKRNVAEHPYQEYGRSQTLEQAEEKDREIRALLDDNNIPYYEITVSAKTDKDIYKLIKEIKKGVTKEGNVFKVTVPDNTLTLLRKDKHD